MESSEKQSLTPSFQLFNKSKELVMANLNVFGILLLLPFLMGLFSNFQTKDLTSFERMSATTPGFNFSASSLGMGALLGLVFIALNVIVTIMMYVLTLDSAKGKKPSIAELWEVTKKHGVKVFLLSVAMAVIILLGLIALIVPGIIFIGRYYLAPYVMLDKDLSVGEALKESARLAKGHTGYIWGLIGVSIVLSLPGIIPVVGWIVSFALTSLYAVAPALRYLELKKLG